MIERAKDNGLWLAFLVAGVVGAVVEEFVFRGILSRSLEATRLGLWGGAVTASAIFAVVHLQYGIAGQLVVFVLGMAFALLRATSGSIWPGVVTHALNNAVALVAMKVVACPLAVHARTARPAVGMPRWSAYRRARRPESHHRRMTWEYRRSCPRSRSVLMASRNG